jgi:cytochrome P450
MEKLQMPNYYNPYSESFRADPWPIYKKMRDEAPVYYIEELDAWALSRFEDVWQASMDRTSYTATRGTSPDALLHDGPPPPSVFLFMDAPQHRLHRDLISSAYLRESVALREASIRALTRELLQQQMHREQVEVHSLASQVAKYTIADFIGLRREEIDHIRMLIDVFYHREPGIAGTTPQGFQAFNEAREFILDLIAKYRRDAPASTSHIHTWLNAATNNTAMSDEEIYFCIFALSITGSDTVPLTTAGTVYYLAQHPEQLAAVRADPALIPQAFAETTRYDQATNILGRTLLCDIELNGQTLRKGRPVLFLYASANRDDREFELPDTYIIARRPRRTLSFGAGMHVCLGQHLARLEGKIILEELITTLPDFTVDTASSKRLFGEFLQGYCHVPIEFKPR